MSTLNYKIQTEWTNDENFNLKNIVDRLKIHNSYYAKQSEQLFKKQINETAFITDLRLFAQGCYVFSKLLDTKLIETKNGWKIKDSRKNSEFIIKQILKDGTALLFQLRYFLTGHTIDFVISGTTSENKLKEKTYKQDEIFGNNLWRTLTVSLTAGEIRLASNLENLKNLDLQTSTLGQQWSNIIKYGLVNSKEDGAQVGFYESESESTTKKHYVYKKTEPDISVYYKWITDNAKSQLSYYYDFVVSYSRLITKKEQFKDMLSYDRGWLYQWGKIKEKEGTLYIDTTSERPLYPFMWDNKREHVPGIWGGDYINGTLNEQYKHQNPTIISIKNLKNILEGGGTGDVKYIGIIKSIQNFLKAIEFNNNSGQVENLANLMSDFVNHNAAELEDFARNQIKRLLPQT